MSMSSSTWADGGRKSHSRDRPSAPFRCLDPQYRRELVRVYASNVAGIIRRFCEECRGELQVPAEQVSQTQTHFSSRKNLRNVESTQPVLWQALG